MASEFTDPASPNGQPQNMAAPSVDRMPSANPAGGGVVDADSGGGLEFILDVPLEIGVELGRTHMLVSDLIKLGQGSVIELSKIAGQSLDIMANQKLIARGEVVVTNEKYGVRLTEIVAPAERIRGLK